MAEEDADGEAGSAALPEFLAGKDCDDVPTGAETRKARLLRRNK